MNPQPLEAALKENGKNQNITITYNFGEFKDQIASLKEKFSKLAERLHQTAEALQDPGRIATAGLVDEMEGGQKDFLELHSKVLEIGNSLGIADFPENEKIHSLKDLELMVNSFAEFEDKRKTFEELKNRVLLVLERVALIGHRDAIDFQPLSEIKAKAAELRQAIADGSQPGSHREMDALANGSQAFSDLLTFIEASSELDDVRWGLVHESVEQNFGKSLAVAASRGKLMIATESIPQRPLQWLSKKEPTPPLPPVLEPVGAPPAAGEDGAAMSKEKDAAPPGSPVVESVSPSMASGKEAVALPKEKEEALPVAPVAEPVDSPMASRRETIALSKKKEAAPPIAPVAEPVGSSMASGKEAVAQVSGGVQSAKKKNGPRVSLVEDKDQTIFDFLHKLTSSLQEKRKQ